MDVTFRKMCLKHLDEVLEIEKVSFPSPWSRNAFVSEITQNEFACYIVAIAGEKVAGYGGMWLILDEAHITNVAVHTAYRMNRVGGMLMLELIRRAILRGVDRMTLEVRPSNHVARRLYNSLGFKDIGRRKRYYTDTNEDAIIMWKDNLSSGGGPGSFSLNY
ncbi:MAG: ribosomal-protein-alanine N-acetyltransferase [Firmicutes bacterium ADurb.Bin456]|nr:MAG: ribosomal-protein-alanine N-acetyltransferase [Firmicutes bacterium ADurb.Bin456]